MQEQGFVSSIQSLGTVDGPGIRYTVFMQGCPLRCACCHNPETWLTEGGTPYTAEALFAKILRYRSYFGDTGGVTLSGGEPLLQARFAEALFRLCRSEGIHTCLDTSGSIFNADVDRLLSVTDYVLLDLKYTNDEDYRAYVGCSMDAPLAFLRELEKRKLPTTVREVIIPSVNDTEESILRLKELVGGCSCVEAIELLPFRKLCHTKYEKLGIHFRFGDREEPTPEKMEALRALL